MLWPLVSHGTAHVARKGEDFHSFDEQVWKPSGVVDANDSGVAFMAFGVYDGHGGIHSADYVRSHLLNEFVKCLTDLASSSTTPASSSRSHTGATAEKTGKPSSRQLWDRLHVEAIKQAFVRADEHCRAAFERSGTTATLVLVVREEQNGPRKSRFPGDARRAFITVANVGDSSVYLDTGVNVIRLNEEHRAGTNKSETRRVEETGGTISRDDPKSPYRLWPGGLMMTRTIGDRDASQAIAEPSVTQVAVRVEINSGGARLIVASDGLWDSVTPKESANLTRKTKNAANSARALMREASKREGRDGDDVTVTVIDVSDAPDTPFAVTVPPDTMPNKPVIMWKPLIGENPSEFVRLLREEEDEKVASEVWFREFEPVVIETDLNQKEFKVAVCEGPLCYLQGRGWMTSRKLRSAVPQLTKEDMKALLVAVKQEEEEAYNEHPAPSESPAWEEPNSSARKKKQTATKREVSKTNNTKKSDNGGGSEAKEGEEKEADSAAAEKKKRSKPRSRDRKNKPTTTTGAPVATEEATHNRSSSPNEGGDPVQDTEEMKEEKTSAASELDHQLFAVGFPDSWSESDARDYFSRFGVISGMVFKENLETSERAVFLSFGDKSDDQIEQLCGKYIINASHMFVVRTRDAFGDVLDGTSSSQQ